MKKFLHPIILVPLTALATAGIVMLPSADAQQVPATAPQPELVTGLPDFTRLVDRVGPGVVSVEARIASRRTGGMAAMTRWTRCCVVSVFRCRRVCKAHAAVCRRRPAAFRWAPAS